MYHSTRWVISYCIMRKFSRFSRVLTTWRNLNLTKNALRKVVFFISFNKTASYLFSVCLAKTIATLCPEDGVFTGPSMKTEVPGPKSKVGSHLRLSFCSCFFWKSQSYRLFFIRRLGASCKTYCYNMVLRGFWIDEGYDL